MEKKKIRMIVREKKNQYWKRFGKENRKKDPLEVLKWA